MWNKVRIIINKETVKPILIWKFSGKDIAIMTVGFFLFYYPVKFASNDFYGLIVGATVFVLLGILLMEMPDHLSILQHIKMWYDYKYNEPREYFYIPRSQIHKVQKQETDEDTLEWLEYQEMIYQNRRK